MFSYVTVSIVIFIKRLDHLKELTSVSRDSLEIIIIKSGIAFYKYFKLVSHYRHSFCDFYRCLMWFAYYIVWFAQSDLSEKNMSVNIHPISILWGFSKYAKYDVIHIYSYRTCINLHSFKVSLKSELSSLFY